MNMSCVNAGWKVQAETITGSHIMPDRTIHCALSVMKKRGPCGDRIITDIAV